MQSQFMHNIISLIIVMLLYEEEYTDTHLARMDQPLYGRVTNFLHLFILC